MASGGKKKTTMAKLNRESRLREKREEKRVKKAARKLASETPDAPGESPADHLQADAGADGPDPDTPVLLED